MKASIAWPIVATMMLGGVDAALARDLKDEVKVEMLASTTPPSRKTMAGSVLNCPSPTANGLLSGFTTKPAVKNPMKAIKSPMPRPIAFFSATCSRGYSTSNPHPKTAIVPPGVESAAWWAASSTPRAKPETTVTPASASSRESRSATSRP